MQTLTFNDGTILGNSYAIESDVGLFLYIRSGNTLLEVATLCADPDNTKKIVEDGGGEKKTIRGYKKLTAVRDEGSGLITAQLRKN